MLFISYFSFFFLLLFYVCMMHVWVWACMCHSVHVKSKNKLQELILSFHIVVGGFLISPIRSNPGYIVHEFPKNHPVSTSHFTVKCWDYRYAPPHLAFSFLFFFFWLWYSSAYQAYTAGILPAEHLTSDLSCASAFRDYLDYYILVPTCHRTEICSPVQSRSKQHVQWPTGSWAS